MHTNTKIKCGFGVGKELRVKWDKAAVLAVVAIFSVSYVYSSIRKTQLSNDVEEEKRKVCFKQGRYDCGLISRYHNECFNSSYRAEYRIRDFHFDEYNNCIDSKIIHHPGTVKEQGFILTK